MLVSHLLWIRGTKAATQRCVAVRKQTWKDKGWSPDELLHTTGKEGLLAAQGSLSQASQAPPPSLFPLERFPVHHTQDFAAFL